MQLPTATARKADFPLRELLLSGLSVNRKSTNLDSQDRHSDHYQDKEPEFHAALLARERITSNPFGRRSLVIILKLDL